MVGRQLVKAVGEDRHRRARDIANSEFLEETGVPRLVAASIIATGCAVGVFLIWSYFATLQEIVRSVGEVVPRNEVQLVQHLEGGVISDVLVEAGQRVERGDPLVYLDGAKARADLDQATVRLTALAMEEERIRATAENRKPVFGDENADNQSLRSDQSRIYESEVAANESQAAVIDRQVSGKRAELRALRNQARSLGEQLVILEEEFAIQEELFKEGVIARARFLSMQQNIVGARGNVQQLKDQVRSMEEAVAELEERRKDVGNQQAQEAFRRLGDVVAARAEIEKLLVSLNDEVDRLIIRSPVSGIVQDVPLQANAGVLPEGGVVAEIVPLEGGLLIESRVSARDIGFLSVGQDVAIKVHAFDFTRYGTAAGELAELSPTTFVDESGNPYYRAKIKLNSDRVGGSQSENQILPGMTVQADITTGNKTVLQYMLKPLYTVVNDSFWER